MRRAVEASIVFAVTMTLVIVAALTLPACSWSSSCSSGRITTETLPDAAVGLAYPFQLTQSCGERDAASWQLPAGEAPPGIPLSWDGLLLGTPSAAGRFTLHVTLTLTSRGAGGSVYQVGSDTRTYTLTVRP